MLTVQALRPLVLGLKTQVSEGSPLRSIPLYSILTAVGLLFGFLRELVVASKFGLSSDLDVLITVMGFHLLFGVQVGNALESVFVSTIAPLNDAHQMRAYLRKALRSLLLANLAILFLLVFGSGYVLTIIFPAFSQEQLRLGAQIIAMLLLPIVFTNTAGLLRGGLSVSGVFSPGFAAGSVVSVCTIGSTVLLSDRYGIFAVLLGFGIGHFLVLSLFLVQLAKTGMLKDLFTEKDARVATFPVWGTASAVLVAEVLYQAIALTERSLASTLETGTIAAFFYAGTIVAIPLSLFTFPITTVLFPRMAKAFTENRGKGYLLMTQYGVMLFIASAVLVIVLSFFAEPIVELVFMRGKFSLDDAHLTGRILSTLVFGLPFLSVYGLIRNSFYSLSDYKIPICGFALQWLLVASGGLLLIPRYGFQGLAIASVASQAVQTVFLGWLLRRRLTSE